MFGSLLAWIEFITFIPFFLILLSLELKPAVAQSYLASTTKPLDSQIQITFCFPSAGLAFYFLGWQKIIWESYSAQKHGIFSFNTLIVDVCWQNTQNLQWALIQC